MGVYLERESIMLVYIRLGKENIVTRRYGVDLEEYAITPNTETYIVLDRGAAEELRGDLTFLLDNPAALVDRQDIWNTQEPK